MVKMMILLYIKNDDTSIYIDSEAEKSPLPHRYLSYPFVVGHDCELVAKGFFWMKIPWHVVTISYLCCSLKKLQYIIDVAEGDMECLNPGSYLTDHIIEIWMKSNDDSFFCIFNTLFGAKL